jgi:hypothetical protein
MKSRFFCRPLKLRKYICGRFVSEGVISRTIVLK